MYNDTIAERIGKRIKKIRLYRNMTIIDLSKKVKVSSDLMRKYEKGQRTPKDDTLQAIADVLNVSVLALTDPILNDEVRIMYALFELNNNYGIDIIYSNDKYYIGINNTIYLDKYVKEWSRLLDDTDTTKLTEWELNFPKYYNEKDDIEKRKEELKEKIEKYQKELKRLEERQ